MYFENLVLPWELFLLQSTPPIPISVAEYVSFSVFVLLKFFSLPEKKPREKKIQLFIDLYAKLYTRYEWHIVCLY